ncbi:Exonuclease 1, partial [Globisporangium splendens]
MGITGLLPALKSITETKGLEEYRGKTLAVDGYCWWDSCSYIRDRLKAQNVQYVVAPYEADAQLAFLTKNGLADGVITEDSDCLPFGCGTVLFKLDKDGVGIGQEIKASNLKKNKGLLFHMFTHEMFLEMCIFSGCDYLPSLPGFGLKKAYTALKQHGTFTKIIRALRLEGKVRIPPTYEAEFEKALLTFRHQRVYDPKTRQIVLLTPIPDRGLAADEDAAMEFLGPMLQQDVAQAIAEGDMDPITMERFPAAAVPPPTTTHNNGEQFTQARNANTFANPLAVTRSSNVIVQGQQRPAQPQAVQQSRPVPAALHQQARKFPVSFASRAEAIRCASQPRTNAKPGASETSPHVISRYFAAQAKRASPLDEAEKSLSSSLGASSSSSFESQEPLEVDIARSISFSPVEEKKQIHATTTKDKENQTPPRDIAPPPVVKENAFSRMMKAGSLIQKQSLKRKATTSMHNRRGKQKSSLFAHQRTSVVQQMKQYAHVATSNSNNNASRSYSASSSSSSCDSGANTSSEREPPSNQDTNEPEVECDAAVDEEPKAVVARGSYLSGVKQAAKAHEDDSNQQSSDANKRPSAQPSTLLASLDRFRYKN